MLKKEISKKSDLGKQIAECQKNYKYSKNTIFLNIFINIYLYVVDDSIVNELVKRQVEFYEKDNISWVIEGFPRTKSQALSLQKVGIIPDRFILLNVGRE